MRSEKEINDALDKLFGEEKDKIDERFFSMTYALRLEEAVKWVIGEIDDLFK